MLLDCKSRDWPRDRPAVTPQDALALFSFSYFTEMASANKNAGVTFALVLCLIFAALTNSSGFVGNIAEENSGSGNWTAASGGRPVQSDPDTFLHHKSRTESSSRAAVPAPRPVRSGSNPYHHNGNRTASQP
ncbi:uncharacterized protein LOC112496324 [Citrus sinensis]|uniref:uncharacterized protein LOC112496324 n=1 Tax=Citrus sinensis TaxID=2711 RepID=UPI000D63100C|nr:uncharacterized protein LOC112496324 [Citrus sinensis]